MRSEEFQTAEMLKRLQRQVSRLRSGDTEESVTIIQNVTDETHCADSVSATVDTNPGFEWGSDAWSQDRW